MCRVNPACVAISTAGVCWSAPRPTASHRVPPRREPRVRSAVRRVGLCFTVDCTRRLYFGLAARGTYRATFFGRTESLYHWSAFDHRSLAGPIWHLVAEACSRYHCPCLPLLSCLRALSSFCAPFRRVRTSPLSLVLRLSTLRQRARAHRRRRLHPIPSGQHSRPQAQRRVHLRPVVRRRYRR
jgi:hypothetical protein